MRISSRAWLIVALAGCDSVFGLRDRPDGGDRVHDAEVAIDGVDASGVEPCASWGPRSQLNEFLTGHAAPTMTADGLELWVASTSADPDLFAGTRGLALGPYAIVQVAALNSVFEETEPSLSADGLVAMFLSTRNGSPAHLFEVRRPDRSSPWANVIEHDELDPDTRPIDSFELSADAQTIYLARANGQLTQSSRVDPAPAFTGERSIASLRVHPTLSPDELTLYYDLQGLHQRQRPDRTAAFDPASDVDLMITGRDPEISADGRTLVYVDGADEIFAVSCL
jgi:hypothetical protein